MERIDSVERTRKTVAFWRAEGHLVGFVPTMGAFHEGHVSLMRRAVAECSKVVVSVFVNPLQFGPNEDYASYPRQLETDAQVASEAGIDLLFAPSVEEMYSGPGQTKVVVDGPARGLCGDFRPGHFTGVATVVAKLFNIVHPHKAYFGQKDAQQLAVIETMVADLDFPVEIVRCPTVREPDGLAMSSRNKYLDGEARAAALCLYRGLEQAASRALGGERRAAILEAAVAETVRAEPRARLEYAELRDARTIEKLDRLEPQRECLLAVAARISTSGGGHARLIDNFIFRLKNGQLEVDRGVFADKNSARSSQ
jgi:pantoate--beta-alanine ligase